MGKYDLQISFLIGNTECSCLILQLCFQLEVTNHRIVCQQYLGSISVDNFIGICARGCASPAVDAGQSAVMLVEKLLPGFKIDIRLLRRRSGVEKFNSSTLSNFHSHWRQTVKYLLLGVLIFKKIHAIDARIQEGDPIKCYMDRICAIIPVQFQKHNYRTSNNSGTTTSNVNPTKEILVQYHKQV